ncbi:cysteine dioxygenase family protein [Winogradskyella sp. 3972H.M.0a.05]|uniref:cysteine dioxygenase n=1 Tax=Winogradskyella sp. 3972H.M.0a.05 TaxID=2950277 RepID=UPI003391F031
MNSLLTVQDLVNKLIESPKTEYTSILEQLKDCETLFSEFESWSEKKYTRNCIYRCDDFELILLCWEEGQKTSIHNHGGEECWLYVLNGKVVEHNFIQNSDESLTLVNTETLNARQVSYINDRIGLHRLGNGSTGRTMSLHLYAKPIERCDFYCEDSEKFVNKELKYDTFKEIEQTSVQS